MTQYLCAYLNGVVDLTKEREAHIAERHPDLLPEYHDRIGEVLSDPDQVRQSDRFANARLFARWIDDVHRGKFVVVVVVSNLEAGRHWIITAYLARRLSGGSVEWKRN